MKRLRFGLASLTCVMILAACQQGESDSRENGDSTEEEESSPVPVEIGLPIRADIVAVYSGTAPIEALAEADVVAKADGEVRSLLAEESDIVEANQVLATLDGDRLRLELSETEARLNKLKSDVQRNTELQSRGLISEGDFEKLRYDLESLQASYNLARLELDYTKIRAPISGVISERYIKIGNTIQSGEPAFKVTSMDPLVAYLHVPEREFRQIGPDQPVLIQIDALDGPPIVSSITRISPVVDPQTGTFKITIEISDSDRRIKPGMFGRMSIVYDRHENVLQIPRSAIIERAGEQSIFVVEDEKAIRKIIETGFSYEGMVEITSGLADEEKVITVGHIGLKNEANVVVINELESD